MPTTKIDYRCTVCGHVLFLHPNINGSGFHGACEDRNCLCNMYEGLMPSDD